MQPEIVIIPGMEIHSLQFIKESNSSIFNQQNRFNLTVPEHFNIIQPVNYLIIPIYRLTFS